MGEWSGVWSWECWPTKLMYNRCAQHSDSVEFLSNSVAINGSVHLAGLLPLRLPLCPFVQPSGLSAAVHPVAPQSLRTVLLGRFLRAQVALHGRDWAVKMAQMESARDDTPEMSWPLELKICLHTLLLK